MERPTPSPATGSAFCRRYLVCAILLVVLVAWQGWMTLGLFGPEAPWQRLGNDQPILSGSHPANLYLGFLGAQALSATGNDCCYDPAFQAAYPRTPIFNGSRLAELFLFLGGGTYQPAAYKVGLAVACMLAPLLILLSARGFGLSPAMTILATAFGLLVWWGKPAQDALITGDLELLLAALALLAHGGFLVRFHRAAGLACWFGLLLTAALAWFAQPLLFPVFLPLWLVFYLSVGTKHRSLTWHLALWGSQLGALAVNAFWLVDWLSFWWLRSPLPPTSSMLPHRTLEALWKASLWGDAADRALAIVLLGSAAVGAWIMNQHQQRAAARVLGLGAGGLLALALLGIAWEPLSRLETSALLVPALWFAALPAALAWTQAFRLLRFLLGARRGLAAGLCLLAALGLAGHETVLTWAERCLGPEPLTIGLGPQQEALVEQLIAHTGPEARILWECTPLPLQAPHWSALLPLLTGRSFVGGLEPEGTIEHASIGIIDQALNGRHISTWSDGELEEYFHLYNIRWVVCWSPATVSRLHQFVERENSRRHGSEKLPGPVLLTSDHGPGRLFTITYFSSFTLRGHAEVVHADSHHITLADVEPDENGVVVLSLHYQTGMRALPSRVRIERERHAHDPIGFIRLHVVGPVARVTLTWDDR